MSIEQLATDSEVRDNSESKAKETYLFPNEMEAAKEAYERFNGFEMKLILTESIRNTSTGEEHQVSAAIYKQAPNNKEKLTRVWESKEPSFTNIDYAEVERSDNPTIEGSLKNIQSYLLNKFSNLRRLKDVRVDGPSILEAGNSYIGAIEIYLPRD